MKKASPERIKEVASELVKLRDNIQSLHDIAKEIANGNCLNLKLKLSFSALNKKKEEILTEDNSLVNEEYHKNALNSLIYRFPISRREKKKDESEISYKSSISDKIALYIIDIHIKELQEQEKRIVKAFNRIKL